MSTNLDRKAIDSFRSGRLMAVLFSTNNVLIMEKRDDNYSEMFNKSAVGLDTLKNESIKVYGSDVYGWSRLISMSEASELFDKDYSTIRQLLECFEDYLTHIHWNENNSFEKVHSDRLNYGFNYHVDFNMIKHVDFVKEVMKFDYEPKDKWSIILSFILHMNNKNKTTEENVEAVKNVLRNRLTLDEMDPTGEKSCIYSAGAYLLKTYPIDYTLMSKNNVLTRAIKNNDFHKNELRNGIGRFVYIVSQNPNTLLSEINYEKIDQRFIDSSFDNSYLASSFNVYMTLVDEYDTSVFDGYKDKITVEQFVNILATSSVELGAHEKQRELVKMQIERILANMEFVAEKPYPNPYYKQHDNVSSFKNSMKEADIFKFFMPDSKFALTTEDKDYLLKIMKLNIALYSYIVKNLNVFKYFVDHKDAMVDFVSSFDKIFQEVKQTSENRNIYFVKKRYDFFTQNAFMQEVLLTPESKWNETFEKFLNDPSIPFSMLMYLEGLMDHREEDNSEIDSSVEDEILKELLKGV